MKKALPLMLIAWLPFITFAQNNPDNILGKWASNDGQARFEIYRTGDGYSAKIIWLAQPLNENGSPKTDKNNPDEKLRPRPVIGLEIFTGLKFNNGVWDGTQIYSPEKGLYAKLKIEVVDGTTLKVIGTKGIFSSAKNWKRI